MIDRGRDRPPHLVSPTCDWMETLERYLNDCEGKRRRMRDRPSDVVLEELRSLLAAFKGVRRSEQESPPLEAPAADAAHLGAPPP